MSSDYLADIIMPDVPEEPEPEPEVQEPQLLTGATPDDEKDEPSHDATEHRVPPMPDDQSEDEDDEMPPEPVKKVKLLKADIFKKKAAPAVIEITDLTDDEDEEEPLPAQVVKKKRAKRAATPAQLAALARGRETSRLKKEKALIDKSGIKEKKLAEKALLKAARMEKNVEKEIQKEANAAKKAQELRDNPPQQTFTKADMEAATEAALVKFETKRKANKVLKKAAQAKEQHDAKVYNDINKALGVRETDQWDQCFSFT